MKPSKLQIIRTTSISNISEQKQLFPNKNHSFVVFFSSVILAKKEQITGCDALNVFRKNLKAQGGCLLRQFLDTK